jgi:hypothetical protein
VKKLWEDPDTNTVSSTSKLTLEDISRMVKEDDALTNSTGSDYNNIIWWRFDTCNYMRSVLSYVTSYVGG